VKRQSIKPCSPDAAAPHRHSARSQVSARGGSDVLILGMIALALGIFWSLWEFIKFSDRA